MIYRFRLDYGTKVTPAQLEVLSRHVREPHTLPTLQEDGSTRGYSFMEGDALAILREGGPNLIIESGEIGATALESIHAKLGELATKLSAPVAPWNERCQVVVPGFGLLAITEVDLLSDGCTDEVRRRLDNGWRILAICPQPDQRRPDYVLGRGQG